MTSNNPRADSRFRKVSFIMFMIVSYQMVGLKKRKNRGSTTLGLLSREEILDVLCVTTVCYLAKRNHGYTLHDSINGDSDPEAGSNERVVLLVLLENTN